MTRISGRGACRIGALFALILAVAGCGGGDGGSGSGRVDGPANGTPVTGYAVGGTVSHLDTGGLTISDGAQTLTLAQGATGFSFQPLPEGTAYSVTVTAQPAGGNCVVSNGSGRISGAAVSNIAIACNTLISQPLAIGVGASGSVRATASRIVLPVSQVGTASTTINAVLDTGSTGTLLNAFDVFPSSMVTTNGFVFPSGQTSIAYDGIVVTNVVGSRTYGSQGADPVTQTGNLGFAQVTFGSGTTATTATMPVLFVYRVTTSSGTTAAPTNFANLIGIDPDVSAIVVGGAAATSATTLCTPQSTSTCTLTSPFRYFSYADGVDKGFVLAKVTLADCVITTPGSCPLSPNLTLGVTATTTAGFTTTGLSSCRTIAVTGTSGEPACSQVIPSVTVASGNASLTGPVIFDSGYPTVRLSVPAGMSFPASLPAGATVCFASGAFSYQYMTGTGYLATTVVQGAGASDYSNTGIGFFTQNSLLVDYAKAVEGWRNGS